MLFIVFLFPPQSSLCLSSSLSFSLRSLFQISFLCFKHIFTLFFFFFLAGRRQFARHEWAQKAAYLLGCTLEELSSSIFKHQAKGLQHSTSFRGGPDDSGQADGSGKILPSHWLSNSRNLPYKCRLFEIEAEKNISAQGSLNKMT